MDAEVIDLTDEHSQPSFASKAAAVEEEIGPIGAEISDDIVEIEDSDDEIEIDAPPSRVSAAPLSRQTHPRKIKDAAIARKRKLNSEKKKKERESAPRNAAVNPANLPGGINFIIIDDSDTDDESEADSSDESFGYATEDTRSRSRQRGSRAAAAKKRPRPTCASGTNGCGSGSAFKRNYYNFRLTREAAESMQEQLFRKAAERMRTTTIARQPSSCNKIPLFPTVELNIASRYPNHWQWKDPHACLGLPKLAQLTQITSQYRKLAKIYHPDKSRSSATVVKFQAITSAYQNLKKSFVAG